MNSSVNYLRLGSRLKAPGSREERRWPSAFSLQPSAERGFTLVEIIIVVIIITMLAAAVVPRLVGRTEQARAARAKSDLQAVGIALDLYELDAGQYPETLEELTAREAPSQMSEEARARWHGPYLKKGLPVDPWGRAYVYKKESQHSQDYDLYSLGADGQLGKDDITNWE